MWSLKQPWAPMRFQSGLFNISIADHMFMWKRPGTIRIWLYNLYKRELCPIKNLLETGLSSEWARASDVTEDISGNASEAYYVIVTIDVLVIARTNCDVSTGLFSFMLKLYMRMNSYSVFLYAFTTQGKKTPTTTKHHSFNNGGMEQLKTSNTAIVHKAATLPHPQSSFAFLHKASRFNFSKEHEKRILGSCDVWPFVHTRQI